MKTDNKTQNEFLLNQLEAFNHLLQDYLNNLHFPNALLQNAVTYVMTSPGKKFRAKLVYACGAIFQIPAKDLHPLALAIEMIHAYSLVHDDLPAMDNDDWRRGKPSCHKAYDEATAILAGNALHHMAFHLILSAYPADIATGISTIILEKIGPQGILSGQSMDLHCLKQDKDINLAQLTEIHHLKTSTLLQAIVLAVCTIAHADTHTAQKLDQFAQYLGLAYQMFDDFGDIYATASWGKKQASDLQNHKFTFAQYYNYDALQAAIRDQLELAISSLTGIDHNDYLLSIIEELSVRLNDLTSK